MSSPSPVPGLLCVSPKSLPLCAPGSALTSGVARAVLLFPRVLWQGLGTEGFKLGSVLERSAWTLRCLGKLDGHGEAFVHQPTLDLSKCDVI